MIGGEGVMCGYWMMFRLMNWIRRGWSLGEGW